MARGVRNWWSGRKAIPIASAFILACILFSSWITLDRVHKLLESQRWVAHTWEVKSSLETLYGRVAAAESDVRAYILSKDVPSYERYRTSQGIVKHELQQVRELTRDNPRQKPLLNGLEKAIDERYDAMRSSSETRRTHDLQSTLDFLTKGPQKGRGLRAMAQVRSGIEACNAEESRLLAQRVSLRESETLQAETSFSFSIAISVFLISSFGLLSNRLVVVREAAADEERELRSVLEREVERTRAAEIRLEATMVDLRRSNEELQNFAFVASHDLQEPLRKIRAFSDRVRRRAGDVLDDESKDSLQRVEAAADRMQRLILDILELSRITTKIRPRAEIDLAGVIEEVADDLQTRLDETGGRVLHGALPAVFADPAQMRQLFQNLVANALKFRRTDEKPEVSIRAVTRPDGRVQVEVTDNGIGFEEKYVDRIFVVFQRLHGRGEYDGSGIGLAIVREDRGATRRNDRR